VHFGGWGFGGPGFFSTMAIVVNDMISATPRMLVIKFFTALQPFWFSTQVKLV
jgi:hypothetical protein